MIRPIHTKVPGRARFKVAGLCRSESLKAFLVARLSRQEGVLNVTASTVTGNLLVLFSADRDHSSMALLIQVLLEERHEDPAPPDAEGIKANSSLLSSLSAAKAMPARIKDKILQLMAAGEEQEPRPWHLMKEEEILSLMETDRSSGLSVKSHQERLKRYGPNLLPEAEPRSKWGIFFAQFKSLPVMLLGAAAGLSLLTGGLIDAAVIMGVVVANALIGYATESEAEKTINSLKHMVHPTAEILREGLVAEIPAEEVVIGDLFLLKPGTYVCADCRILAASHLTIDESVLTGESMPVLKSSRTLRGKDVLLQDRSNMVFMGTLVTGGEGMAVVVATGRFTEMGRLQLLLGEAQAPETPIERRLRRVGDQLVLLGVGICGVVFLIGSLRGYGFLQMLRIAVSLAAAAVPEGLPAAATINFSIGISNMRKRHVLIRRLQAVETLGAVQTVCLDKTGTLTWNRMSISEIYAGSLTIAVTNGRFLLDQTPVDPLRYEEVNHLIRTCVLCNETKINGGDQTKDYLLHGSPTETALIRLALNAGIDVRGLREDYPLIGIDHRTESRLFMRTLHTSPNGGDTICALKGSPPEVLALCTRQMKDGRRIPLTEEARLAIEKENDRMASGALRVLGVAFSGLEPREDPQENGTLTWLGLVGMADPIREGADNLIRVYHRAGIHTVMITGDQSPTAYTVATKLNLSGKEPLEILDSSEIRSIPPELFEALARKAHVYSRVSPSNKLQIVQALQKAGQVVAMTGDGINDGPALKAADIGIAMGRSGTDVAREVADIVLEEDDLETLIIAVRDGRTTYNNIRKSVHFFLSTNLTEVIVMFTALSAGIGFPLNVMQLLWINILSDIFPGLALSMEAPEPDILEQPPRDPKEPILSPRDFRRMAFESAVISAGALGAYAFGLARYGPGARASTLAFHSLTTGQILHALSCRSEQHGIFDAVQPPVNKYLALAVGGSLFLQALTVLLPGLRRFLGLTPLSAFDIAAVGSTAMIPLLINESTKKREATKP
jgi:P-type Ca2+ transporter type 2C